MFKSNTQPEKGFHYERRLMVQSQVRTEINPTRENYNFKMKSYDTKMVQKWHKILLTEIFNIFILWHLLRT